MSQYTAITIIYNPNSTGASEKLARGMQAKLQAALPSQKIVMAPTERTGHATELAYELAKKTAHPLVISVSGDGGYHEVVNGLMRAQNEGSAPVAGLLPAGNANDHLRNLHKSDFVEAVTGSHEQCIDLLKLTATVDDRPFERYAHSYIGIGLTSKVGHELNQAHLNRLKEAVIFAKELWQLEPVQLEVDGKVHEYDSLVFSNVHHMSKVFLVSKETKMDDGKFEVTALYRRDKLKLVGDLVKASTTGAPNVEQVTSFAFQTLEPTLVQLDGEVTEIDAKTTATVTIEPCTLHCIV